MEGSVSAGGGRRLVCEVCYLCLAEKHEILTANDDALLNKRTELINKCRHKNKYKLINAKLKL